MVAFYHIYEYCCSISISSLYLREKSAIQTMCKHVLAVLFAQVKKALHIRQISQVNGRIINS